jgi:hypothetical protein
MEAPTSTSEADWPTLSSYIQFDAPGGHQFIVTGTIAHQDDIWLDDDVSWAVQAGANINLADIATLTVGGLYGDGNAPCLYLSQDPFCSGGFVFHSSGGDFVSVGDFAADESWGITAGLSFGITDTTTFNVQYGITHMENGAEFHGDIDSLMVQTVHANILWRPVQQMQLGWEVMWGEYDFDGGDFDAFFSGDEIRGGRSSDDAIRAQFGAWFFF